jgi:hypothetical protein
MAFVDSLAGEDETLGKRRKLKTVRTNVIGYSRATREIEKESAWVIAENCPWNGTQEGTTSRYLFVHYQDSP